MRARVVSIFALCAYGVISTLAPALALPRLSPSHTGVAGATLLPVSKRMKDRATMAPSELSGRYAVMREKRDTGCMLTLDEARAKGGERAQLAPGCRDQGIVVFDPTVWQFVGGELVLTARAGHKTHLLKAGEGVWLKDPKDGGKPLGLKKL
jgi:hypothetical protein